MSENLKKVGGAWIPQKKDDEISGKLIKVIDEVGDYKSKGYVIETDEEIRTAYGSTVLDRKMQDSEVHEGDFVKIVFLGEVKSQEKGKQDYKNWDLYVAYK